MTPWRRKRRDRFCYRAWGLIHCRMCGSVHSNERCRLTDCGKFPSAGLIPPEADDATVQV